MIAASHPAQKKNADRKAKASRDQKNLARQIAAL